MFDLFNPPDVLEEKFKEIAIQLTTITIILIEKKVVSEDEFMEFKKSAVIMVDKAFKDAKDEMGKEFENKYPAISQFFKTTKVGESTNE
ncbi:MAG: hypothetical protein PHQ35_09370 [Phycisphaerae bacterium]|nr:hypothetical protein [Phycisphaerae bacterium]MDD5239926.1 hypothetical protein [Candidatus Nanoarchaeia archaeon]